MLESTPLLQKNGSLDLKELFNLFCDATKTDFSFSLAVTRMMSGKLCMPCLINNK